MSSLWSIRHHGKDPPATVGWHRGPRADSVPGTGRTPPLQALPLLPKHRNLTHPIFLNSLSVSPKLGAEDAMQTSQPPLSVSRALPMQLAQRHPRTGSKLLSRAFVRKELVTLRCQSRESYRRSVGGGYCGMARGAGPHITCTECLPAAIKSAFKERSQLSQRH